MTYSVTWLADVLKKAGCKVVEEPDWKNKGVAEMGAVQGVLCHHTAGSTSGNSPSLDTVKNGRSDLPGPLSHLFLARDGTFHVLAAGKCNHAGEGSWQGVTSGNSHFLGIEAENAGTGKDPWPAVQMEAYERGVAALLAHIKAQPIMSAGHKEYATPKGRKIDPAFDMIAFRGEVSEFLYGEGSSSPIVPSTNPEHDMLRKGDSGPDVVHLQELLGDITADGAFGPKTESSVKSFQKANGLIADGLVGPKTWAALEAAH